MATTKAAKKDEAAMTSEFKKPWDVETDGRPARADNMGSAPLAKVGNSSLAVMTRDALDGMELDFTGLEGIGAEDFRLATLVWNVERIDPQSRETTCRKKDFLNTVTEEAKDKVNLVLLVLHKSKVWSEFVDNKKTVHCSSWDGIIGTTQTGTQRPCEGCPDAQWTQVNGKPTRRCDDVHNVVASDLNAGGDLVMLRMKSSSLGPWKTFLNKYFLGKRVVQGKRTHYPLFAFPVAITLRMEAKPGVTPYAVPVFSIPCDESGKPIPLSIDEVQAHADNARGIKELYLDRVRKVADDAEKSSADDTGFDFGANAKGFIDTKAEPETATRFE